MAYKIGENMKIKEGFMLRLVAEEYVVVPVGQASIDFNGMMNLNETGAFLFERLLKGCTKEELVAALMDEYDVDIKTANIDVDAFVTKLKEENLFE